MAKKASEAEQLIVTPPGVRQMIDEALAIEIEDAKKADALGFMSSTLAQVTLPHSKTDLITYKRTNGRLTLKIRADEDYKMPYGSLPRLLLSWVCSEAVKTRNRQIMLGYCQADFIRERMKIRNAGGEYTDAVRRQVLALFNSLITVDVRDDKTIALENILIARRAFMFWNQKRPDQPVLWESYLMLDQDFFDSIIQAPVPIDLRVLHALRKSPMAMDIYTWLVYRVFLLRVSGKEMVRIPWGALELQFGAGYSSTERRPEEGDAKYIARIAQGRRDFRKNFVKALRSVLVFYPDASRAIEVNKDHFQLKPCRLHIDSKVVPLA